MFVPSEISRQLKAEASWIIEEAVKALEANQTTALAQSRLRELIKKLQLLEYEAKGGCSW